MTALLAENTPREALLVLSKGDLTSARFPDQVRGLAAHHLVAVIYHGSMGVPGGDWEETVVPIGPGGEGYDVSPDGKGIWLANAQDGTVSIIDVATKKVIDTLPSEFKGANRLKFTPYGKLVLITASRLAVLDSATHKEIKRLDTVRSDAGIQMQPNGWPGHYGNSL